MDIKSVFEIFARGAARAPAIWGLMAMAVAIAIAAGLTWLETPDWLLVAVFLVGVMLFGLAFALSTRWAHIQARPQRRWTRFQDRLQRRRTRVHNSLRHRLLRPRKPRLLEKREDRKLTRVGRQLAGFANGLTLLLIIGGLSAAFIETLEKRNPIDKLETALGNYVQAALTDKKETLPQAAYAIFAACERVRTIPDEAERALLSGECQALIGSPIPLNRAQQSLEKAKKLNSPVVPTPTVTPTYTATPTATIAPTETAVPTDTPVPNQ